MSEIGEGEGLLLPASLFISLFTSFFFYFFVPFFSLFFFLAPASKLFRVT